MPPTITTCVKKDYGVLPRGIEADGIGGLYSTYPFENHTVVYAKYCDGGSWTGAYNTAPVKVGNETIYFRGKALLDGLLDHLFKVQGLNQARLAILQRIRVLSVEASNPTHCCCTLLYLCLLWIIILTSPVTANYTHCLRAPFPSRFLQATELLWAGCSAGGLTTYIHADWIAEQMKDRAPAAKVVALADAMFSLNHDDIEGDGHWPRFMQFVYHANNAADAVNQDCVNYMADSYGTPKGNRSEGWRCK